MIEKKITLVNRLGLHARATAKLIKLTGSFASNIEIDCKGQVADGKRIMNVMLLGASVGSELTLRICGQDEGEAMAAICALVGSAFGEDE